MRFEIGGQCVMMLVVIVVRVRNTCGSGWLKIGDARRGKLGCGSG